MIKSLIEKVEYSKVWKKTTVCLLTTKSWFEIVTSSSCIDPEDYDEDIWAQIAYERAVDKLWELEGYKQQWVVWWRIPKTAVVWDIVHVKFCAIDPSYNDKDYEVLDVARYPTYKEDTNEMIEDWLQVKIWENVWVGEDNWDVVKWNFWDGELISLQY